MNSAVSGCIYSGSALAPVVDHIDIRPIESIRIGTVHGNALRGYPVTARAHPPEGIFASQVHACLQRDSARGSKRVASFEQAFETFTGSSATASGAELDVAEFAAALRSRSVETNRESIKNTARVRQEDVAGALREHGPDFTGEIESLKDSVGKLRTLLDGLLAPGSGEGG